MKSIKAKILVGVITVAVAGAIAIGGVACGLSYKSTMDTLKATLEPSAQIAAITIEEKLQNYWAILSEAAALDVFHQKEPEDPDIIRRSNAIAERNEFIRVGKVDVNGWASTGEDISQEDYFQKCKQENRNVIYEVTISTVDGNPIIVFMSPIQTNGQFDGCVYGVIDAGFLSEIVSNIHMGKEGEAYVLDRNGNVIGHSNPTKVIEQVNTIEEAKSDSSLQPLAQLHEKMLAGEKGFGTYTYEGEAKLFGYAPISGEQSWSIGVAAHQDEFLADLYISIIAIVAIVVAVSGAGVIVAFAMARSVSRPIKQCVDRLALLEQGNLSAPVPEVTTKDETALLLGSLGRTISKLNIVVEDISYHMKEMAKGNFQEDIAIQYEGDFVAIQTAITDIHISLNNTLSQIREAAQEVSNGADQVSNGAQSLSQGVTEQAGSVEELAATITDISNQVQSNAQNAQAASEKASEVGENMQLSNQKMQDMIRAMDEINSTSDEISKIIKTIEDIAFQTNILALNAAVEAARAGTAGKGFAVVADEVRNLASKSAEASKNTSSLIERSLSAVKNGTEIANETAQSLLYAVERASYVVGLIDEIAEASNQQAKSVEQVTIGVNQISEVIQTNSATSEESAAASEELSGQSHLMQQLVGRFQLNGMDAGMMNGNYYGKDTSVPSEDSYSWNDFNDYSQPNDKY